MITVRGAPILSHGHYGWIPDRYRTDRPKYQLHRVVRAKARPPRVDFRDGPSPMPGIVEQGELGSCTANAIAAVVKYLQARQGLPEVFLPSRLAIYYWERERRGTIDEDSGASIDDEMFVVRTIGTPEEDLWQYNIAKFKDDPGPAVKAAAAHHLVPKAFQIVDGINGIMDSLEAGFPVAFGILIYESFETQAVANTGDVPMPNAGHWWQFCKAAPERLLGGHAIWACGYDQPSKRLFCVNSWGTMWGDGGYMSLPFAYVEDTSLFGPAYSVQLVTET